MARSLREKKLTFRLGAVSMKEEKWIVELASYWRSLSRWPSLRT
jgi:hypothetical protein